MDPAASPSPSPSWSSPTSRGSIPFGVLVARLTGAPDPRTLGSGRTGGTNALRAMGRKWAAVVVTGDLLKGAIPVLVARFVTGNAAVEVAVRVAAILGSIRSMFVGFQAAAASATSVGTMLVIQPVAVLLAAPVFIVRDPAHALRVAGLAARVGRDVPGDLLVLARRDGTVPLAYPVYATLGPTLVWLAHADNIDRLIHGTERKFDLGLLGGRRLEQLSHRARLRSRRAGRRRDQRQADEQPQTER